MSLRLGPLLLAAIGCGLAFACKQRLEVLDDGSDAETSLEPAPAGSGNCSCSPAEYCHVGQCLSPSSTDVLAAGSDHTCTVRHGALWCWGSNLSGQIGVGNVAVHDVPTRVGSALDWFDVSAGGRHTCGLRAPGRLYCWGDNTQGQLGDGTTRGHTSPEQVGTASDYRAVAAGGDNSCALRGDYALYCWGNGNDGRSGVRGAQPRPIAGPTPVAATLRFDQVAVGAAHSCGIRQGGSLWCWGRGADGELGLGSERESQPEPVQIGRARDWTRIAVGAEHSCGIRARRITCWGGNDYAQVGVGREGPDGVRLRIDEPGPVDPGANWLLIATGDFHTCASSSVPALFCWGRNTSGQLGVSEGSDIGDTPARLPLIESVRLLALGAAHSCALDADRQLYCWGDNVRGQLGLNDTRAREQPTRLTISDAVADSPP